MFKKKKEIDRTEFVPTTLGKVENNTIGLLYLTIVFIVLFFFVFYLPEIHEYFSNDSTSEEILTVGKEEYDYSEGTSFSNDYATISNVIFQDNTLSFDITNDLSEYLSLYSEYVYFEGYNDQDKLLFRLNFEDILLESGEVYHFEMELVVGTVDYFVFDKMTESDYPEVELSVDENSNEYLVCSNEEQTLTYYFKGDLLYEVNLKIDSVEDEYLDNYVTLYQNYLEEDGVVSTITEDYNVQFSASYDISEYDEYLYGEDFLFTDNEKAKVVNFINISKGYDCY